MKENNAICIQCGHGFRCAPSQIGKTKRCKECRKDKEWMSRHMAEVTGKREEIKKLREGIMGEKSFLNIVIPFCIKQESCVNYGECESCLGLNKYEKQGGVPGEQGICLDTDSEQA